MRHRGDRDAQMSHVHDDDVARRYELDVDGETAFAAYRLDGDTITFVHTVVPHALEGRGVGSALVRGALDDVRARGLRVVAQCSFVAGFVDRHPEYNDLLA